MRVRLAELCLARSGDKGDTCNVGVIARSPEIRMRSGRAADVSPATTAIYTALDRSDMAAVVARIEVPSAAA